MPITELNELAKDIRKELISLHFRSQTSHIGSCFSSIEILLVLYYRIMNIDPQYPNEPTRDRFILSKGHAAPALYSILSRKGFFSADILESYGEEGSVLYEHPVRSIVPGIEATTGSLGHGLPIGAGIAYAGKLDKSRHRVFVLMSDGECQEGSVWEAAMMASALKLDNLTCIIDYNNLQGFGVTEHIQGQERIIGRFNASGWSIREVDGHDLNEIEQLLSSAPFEHGKPSLLFARTIKGKGVPEMENRMEWHYKSPTKEQVDYFIAQVDSQ